MEKINPSVFNISGPYAVGKDTMLNAILQTFEQDVHRVSTITTRPTDPTADPSYKCVTEQEFASITSHGKWIINRQLGSNSYGTSIDEIEQKISTGKICIHSIYPGPAGAGKLREVFGEKLISVALLPTAGSHDVQIEELRKRMIARKRESMEVIEKRITTQSDQINYILENASVDSLDGPMPVFDKIVINEILDESLEMLIQYFRSQFNI